MASRGRLLNGLPKKGGVLDRFLLRHQDVLTVPENLVPESAQAAESRRARLFEGHKSPLSGRWVPPLYSLRQQSRLIKEAVMSDRLELMPSGPVTDRYVRRLRLSAEQEQLEAQLAQFRYIPEPPKDQIVPRPRGLHKKGLKPSQRISESERLEAVRIASTHIKEVGPYAGRGKIFKGSKYDREKPERLENIQQKLKAMPSIVADWKQVSCLSILCVIN